LDEKSEIIAQGEALQKLIEAMHTCRDAEVPRAEILEVIRPYLLEDDDIALEGTLVEHLSDGDASQLIQIVYEALLSGARFMLVDGRRTRKELLDLCDGLGEVTFNRDGKKRRVTITKPPF
jgi:hypothetical protein